MVSLRFFLLALHLLPASLHLAAALTLLSAKSAQHSTLRFRQPLRLPTIPESSTLDGTPCVTLVPVEAGRTGADQAFCPTSCYGFLSRAAPAPAVRAPDQQQMMPTATAPAPDQQQMGLDHQQAEAPSQKRVWLCCCCQARASDPARQRALLQRREQRRMARMEHRECRQPSLLCDYHFASSFSSHSTGNPCEEIVAGCCAACFQAVLIQCVFPATQAACECLYYTVADLAEDGMIDTCGCGEDCAKKGMAVFQCCCCAAGCATCCLVAGNGGGLTPGDVAMCYACS